MSLPPFVPSHPRDWTDLTASGPLTPGSPAQTPQNPGILGPSTLHSAAQPATAAATPASPARPGGRTHDVSRLGTARGMRSNRPATTPRG
jgi:hypothetical protein